jgi:hypothetical protein
MTEVHDSAHDPASLPDEVRELFEEREGRWSRTQANVFDYTCEGCKQAAICRLDRGISEDRWSCHCQTKACEWHGEFEVAAVVLEDDEAEDRRYQQRSHRRTPQDSAEEVSRYLTVAQTLRDEPASETVYTQMLDGIRDVIRRYVWMSDDAATICALWVVHTWCLPATEFTPYLHFRSALPTEGKSQFLVVAKHLVARPLVITDPTPIAIANHIEYHRLFLGGEPTMLWDEIDSAYKRQNLREYINNGFQRGNHVLRAQRQVPTFAPKAMAGLTEVPNTVRSRSFRFDMLRVTRDEGLVRLSPKERRKLKVGADVLKLGMTVFAERHMDDLAVAEPRLPAALDDRAMDISEPLLAIADVVGGDWPKAARRAVVNVRNAMKRDTRQSEGEMLLADIKRSFGSLRKQMYSKELSERLTRMEERPWQRMTQRKLADMLHEFLEYPGGPRITSRRIRIGGRAGGKRQAAGYNRHQFEDAWKRYGI